MSKLKDSKGRASFSAVQTWLQQIHPCAHLVAGIRLPAVHMQHMKICLQTPMSVTAGRRGWKQDRVSIREDWGALTSKKPKIFYFHSTNIKVNKPQQLVITDKTYFNSHRALRHHYYTLDTGVEGMMPTAHILGASMSTQCSRCCFLTPSPGNDQTYFPSHIHNSI